MSRTAELLNGGYWDSKMTDKRMHDILSNICFEVIDPYSRFVYKTGDKQLELQKLTNVVFNKIGDAIKAIRKAKTYEDFWDELIRPIVFAQETMDFVKKKMPFVEFPEEEPKLLVELADSSSAIFERFYNKKKRKLKRRKNVRTKS